MKKKNGLRFCRFIISIDTEYYISATSSTNTSNIQSAATKKKDLVDELGRLPSSTPIQGYKPTNN